MEFIGNRADIEKEPFVKAVFDILEHVINDDNSYLYYKYPFYKGQISEELIEAKLLLVSSCYGIYCFDLDNEGKLDDYVRDRVDSLYNEISSRMLKFAELRQSRNELKYKINTVLVGSYSELIEDKDYILCPINRLEAFIQQRNNGLHSIPDDMFLLINSCIDGTSNLQKKKDRKKVKEKSRAYVLNDIQAHIAAFDVQQKRIASVEIESPQRVRGLAGSGKTVILAYKAAIYHARHPEHRILYTFYTKSLGDSVRELINRAYRNYNNAEPDWSKITICHAWGSASSEGVYYTTCINNELTPMSFSQAKFHSEDAFGYICGELLKSSIMPEYDLILIDEGQDFPVEFYRLCYRLCKGNKKICWAYDDFQNIFDVKIQNEKDTFGYDENGNPYVDFAHGDENCDTVLKKCYRTPRYSLIYAFALGLGIYNSKVLQRLGSNGQWEALGFKVEQGNSQTGDNMVISRPKENTPFYSNDVFDQESIQCEQFHNFEEECGYICQTIVNAIKNDELLPTDICVICIDSQNIRHYFERISTLLRQNNIASFNLLNAPYNNTSFFREGYVTLSTVNKAKGNECGMVIICGIDVAFEQPNNVVMRDRIFTSMTRTKGWLYLTGCNDNMQLLLKEFQCLKANDYKLVFEQPDESSTKNIENVSRVTVTAQVKISNTIESLRHTGMSDEEIKELLHNLLNSNK